MQAGDFARTFAEGAPQQALACSMIEALDYPETLVARAWSDGKSLEAVFYPGRNPRPRAIPTMPTSGFSTMTLPLCYPNQASIWRAETACCSRNRCPASVGLCAFHPIIRKPCPSYLSDNCVPSDITSRNRGLRSPTLSREDAVPPINIHSSLHQHQWHRFEVVMQWAFWSLPSCEGTRKKPKHRGGLVRRAPRICNRLLPRSGVVRRAR